MGIDKEFEVFKGMLFKQLADGNFLVKVKCQDSKLFDAKVIGWDDEFMDIHVEFISNELWRPERVQIKTSIPCWFSGEEDVDYYYETRNVPVKRIKTKFTNIIL